MEWQRSVEIFGSHDGKGSRGSGYLLADRLILTARHVIEGLSEVRVRFLVPDTDGLPNSVSDWQEAKIAWTGAEALDLALLEPPISAAKFNELPGSVKIARLGGRAVVPVDALGYPRAMETAEHSDTLHIEATVNVLSGVRSEVMLLDVQTVRSRVAHGWKGMSGAAVFAGDCLVAAMREVPGELDETVLQATPIFSMLEEKEARALLDQSKVRQSDPFFIDADYVARLPRSGTWTDLRKDYARAVLRNFCCIDHVGMGVSGTSDVKIAALDSYNARRLRLLFPGIASN